MILHNFAMYNYAFSNKKYQTTDSLKFVRVHSRGSPTYYLYNSATANLQRQSIFQEGKDDGYKVWEILIQIVFDCCVMGWEPGCMHPWIFGAYSQIWHNGLLGGGGGKRAGVAAETGQLCIYSKPSWGVFR
jgi:hypothetical protein